MTVHLQAVRIARDRRARTLQELEPLEDAYRRAILQAYEAGHGIWAISRYAGISHMGVKAVVLAAGGRIRTENQPEHFAYNQKGRTQ